MDNPCYLPDMSMEMESINIQDDMSIEKEKKTVNFEQPANMKANNPNQFSEVSTIDSSQIQQIKNDIKPYPGYCQPDVCKESSKKIEQLKMKNAVFDRQLKLKKLAFLILCISLVTWVIVHFCFFA